MGSPRKTWNREEGTGRERPPAGRPAFLGSSCRTTRRTCWTGRNFHAFSSPAARPPASPSTGVRAQQPKHGRSTHALVTQQRNSAMGTCSQRLKTSCARERRWFVATGNYGLRTYVLPQGYCISFRCSWGRGAQHSAVVRFARMHKLLARALCSRNMQTN